MFTPPPPQGEKKTSLGIESKFFKKKEGKKGEKKEGIKKKFSLHQTQYKREGNTQNFKCGGGGDD